MASDKYTRVSISGCIHYANVANFPTCVTARDNAFPPPTTPLNEICVL